MHVLWADKQSQVATLALLEEDDEEHVKPLDWLWQNCARRIRCRNLTVVHRFVRSKLNDSHAILFHLDHWRSNDTKKTACMGSMASETSNFLWRTALNAKFAIRWHEQSKAINNQSNQSKSKCSSLISKHRIAGTIKFSDFITQKLILRSKSNSECPILTRKVKSVPKSTLEVLQ